MRSEIKRYRPTWRERLIYRWGLFLDFVFRQSITTALRGPWCLKCGSVWPDKDILYLKCLKCGTADEAAAKRIEEAAAKRIEEAAAKKFQEEVGSYRNAAPGERRKKKGFSFTKDDMRVFASMGPMGGILALGMLSFLAPKKGGWWKAFGLKRAPDTKELARVAYRDALKNAHPDQGGSEAVFNKVRSAWDKAERYYAKREAPQTADQV